MSESHPELILASASPRRAELLARTGHVFRILPSSVSEIQPGTMSPEALAVENARLKALDIALQEPGAMVIGCDTIVCLDGQVLGKPRDRKDAVHMHRALTGRTHTVISGVAILCRDRNMERMFHESTEVEFRALTEAEINTYLDQIVFLDKAGAYAAQNHGDMIIAAMHGSMSNVMGLPMERLQRELGEMGVGRVPGSEFSPAPEPRSSARCGVKVPGCED